MSAQQQKKTIKNTFDFTTFVVQGRPRANIEFSVVYFYYLIVKMIFYITHNYMVYKQNVTYILILFVKMS